jgi:hypothetical protein
MFLHNEKTDSQLEMSMKKLIARELNNSETSFPFSPDDGAYSKIDGVIQETEKQRKRIFNNFLINNLLLVCAIVTIFSGLLLQIGFHMGEHDEHQTGDLAVQSHTMQYEHLREIDTNKIVCGFSYPAWSAIHKFVIVSFLLLMVYHTYVHWKWYKIVFTKHLIGNNKQIIILTILFLLVAVTGFTPWLIDLSGSTSIIRMLFIEIHDKLTFILIVFLVLHFIKKVKWFITTYAKLKKQY